MNRSSSKVEHLAKKIARWSKWCLAGLVVMLVGMHFLLPLLINTPPVKERIIAAARNIMPGRVEFDRLRPGLLPTPNLVVTRGQFHISGKLNISTESITVYPEILPLLIGRIQIGRVTIQAPTVEIQLTAGQKGGGAPVAIFPVQDTAAIHSALSRLPQGMDVMVSRGVLNLVRNGRSVAHFEALKLRAEDETKLLRFHVQAQSNLVEDFQVQAELTKASLDLKGQADFLGLMPAAVTTALWPGRNELTVGATTDIHLAVESQGLQTLYGVINAGAPAILVKRGAEAFHCQGFSFAGNLLLANQHLQVSLSQLKTDVPRLNMNGALSWAFRTSDQPENLQLSLQVHDSDATAWRTAAFMLNPDLAQWLLFDIVRGGTLGSMVLEASGPSWPAAGKLANLKIAGTAVGAQIHVPGVKLDLTEVDGDWQVTAGVLKVKQASARLGDSQATHGSLSIGLVGKPHPIDLNLDLDADLAQLPPILKKVIPNAGFQAELGRIKSVQGRANGRLRLAGTLAEMTVAVDARDIRLKADYDRLPAPVEVQRGEFKFDSHGITLKAIEASMGASHVAGLDGLMVFQVAPSFQFSLKGAIDAQLLQWAQDFFKLPAEFNPKAPIGIKALDISWHSGGRISVDGALTFPDELQLGIGFKMAPDFFDLHRLALTDERSNALIALRHDTPQNTWDARFDGRLESTTVAKLWQWGPDQTGWIKGRFSTHFSITDPARSTVQGTLTAGDMVVPLGPSFGTVRIHQADLASGQRELAIHNLDLSWMQQRVSMAGDILFADQALQMDLSLTADRLDVGEIEKAFQYRSSKVKTEKSRNIPRKLPTLTGKIEVDTKQLVYGSHRWQPFRATMTIAPNRIDTNVHEAFICGLSTLGSVRWSSQGLWLEVIPKATDQKLQLSGGCLIGSQTTERIEGTFNVVGKITTSGDNRAALLQNMNGWINFDAVDGRFTNAGEVGLLTNILAYLRINKLITGDVPDLKKRDFKYHKILLGLKINKGHILLDQADIRGDTLNLVAEGTIDLAKQQLALTVLVSPLTGIDTLVRHIPLVGNILKGTLIAIPVGVRGPIANPRVVPLSPRAVGERLKGILERTLEAPFQLVEPLFESNQNKENAPEKEKKGSSR